VFGVKWYLAKLDNLLETDEKLAKLRWKPSSNTYQLLHLLYYMVHASAMCENHATDYATHHHFHLHPNWSNAAWHAASAQQQAKKNSKWLHELFACHA
jgi:hypothetical protein